jgi:hypothetical protein
MMAIRDGWRPSLRQEPIPITIDAVAKKTLSRKLSMDYSASYKKDLTYTEKLWSQFLQHNNLSDKPITALKVDAVRDFVFEYAPSPASMANFKRNISALIKDELESNGVLLNLSKIKLPKQGQELHRPINDIPAVLNDIKQYNDNLHLCCLMTYSMLLRPHREIRCLSFSDFNSDFTVLSLDGNRVKSKRNRILPVPAVVREEIVSRFETVENRNVNLFSMRRYEHNPSYFKGHWTKYKKQSELIGDKQTLYSFRHTGAIKVFEKTTLLIIKIRENTKYIHLIIVLNLWSIQSYYRTNIIISIELSYPGDQRVWCPLHTKDLGQPNSLVQSTQTPVQLAAPHPKSLA